MNYGYIPKDDPSYNLLRAEKFAENCALIFSECLKGKEDKEMNKTFDKKDVITCINAEDAKKYIGKLGYFANGLNGFADIDYFAPYSLDHVQVGIDKPFFYREKNFALFLPEDKVTEVKKEKKYRPFKTIQEFRDVLCNIEFSEPIQIRYKDNINNSIMTIFTGYQELGNELTTIGLGAWIISPQDAFYQFEVYNDKTEEWQPFGVLENES